MRDPLTDFFFYAELIAFVFTAVLLVVVVLVKLLELHRQDKRSQDYRIVPKHGGWTRTEIIATAGLAIAILGLVISLLRR